MPIIGWKCPHCNSQVALNHYEVSECGLLIHPAYAAAILRDEETDPHGDRTTVTSGLSCPRGRAIEAAAAVYVNPLEYNALLLGRAWDAIVAGDEKIQLKGEIAGITIEGELDNIRRLEVMLILSDWKHSNNFRAKHIKAEGKPSAEYQIQTSMYAELYFQMHGERPTHGEVVYHFSGAGKEVLLPFQYPLWPLDDCLAYKPYSGQTTVRELLQQSERFYKGEVGWEQLPAVGMGMSFGTKSYCDYCQVKDTCMTQLRGAPF
jgi:hypothetical protein